MVRGGRFDLDTLEFQVIRNLLVERLTTALGRREVEDLAPLPTADAANAAIRESAELAERSRRGDRPPVAGAVEVRSWLESFMVGEHQADVRDLADLKRLLRAATRVRGWLESDTEGSALRSMAMGFPTVGDIAEELERILDDRGEILSSASLRLQEIRREIDAAEAGVRAAVGRFLADETARGCLQSSEPSWRHGRPVFQVRYEMRHRVPGVLHDRSQSGATVFVEPSSVVEAANQLSDARAAEHREIQVILTHVCRGLRRCRAEIEGAVVAMARLDVAMARARLIEEDGYRAVPVVEQGSIKLRRALHPLLIRSHQDRAGLVPIDVTLGDPFRLLVITGPNTGGKTVALKTIGLLTLMAMAGLPLPVEAGSQIRFFDGVFADIGDEQAISQNLSTFSSHVTRIARCLAGATSTTLVLLDELGAGTDPEEGGALGYAVLEELERRGVHAVVTTHLGRLKEFAYQHSGAENGAMAFDSTTLRPLFRLEIGIPGTSHALDIASRVGMPASLIDRARVLMGRRDTTLENMIERLQATRQRAEADRQRHEEKSRAVVAAEAELERKHHEVDRRKAWLEEEADALVEEQLRAARAALEPPLRQLANAPRPFDAEAKRLLEAVGDLLTHSSIHRRRMRFVGSLRRDGVVYVPRLGKSCIVKKVDRTRDLLTVEVGKMRLEVPFEDVSWLQPLDV